MQIKYFKDTETLYITLSSALSVESTETTDGVVLDLDANGVVVGIEIENTKRILDLSEFHIDLPITGFLQTAPKPQLMAV